MPDYFKPVRAGDKLDIKAPTWNAMIEAAKAHLNRLRAGGRPGQSDEITPAVVDVYNGSGEDAGAMAVLGIDDILIAPSDDLQQFVNAPVLACVTPTADHAGKFVVTINRIAPGGFGKGIILGATVVKVDMQAADDKYADVYAADTTKLKSAANGAARILFVESGTGVRWAMVRIGGGGGGESWLGQYKGQIHGMVADAAEGAEYAQFVPVTPS